MVRVRAQTLRETPLVFPLTVLPLAGQPVSERSRSACRRFSGSRCGSCPVRGALVTVVGFE